MLKLKSKGGPKMSLKGLVWVCFFQNSWTVLHVQNGTIRGYIFLDTILPQRLFLKVFNGLRFYVYGWQQLYS